MKKISLFISLAFLLMLSCGDPPLKKNAQASHRISGEKIYKTYCVNCHGLDGKLAFNGAKDLNESTMTYENRILLIRNGRNLMTPFKDMLSPAEIKAVAKYTMKYNTSD